jgi:formylglycine-generating enzyme required for sulfatase activity
MTTLRIQRQPKQAYYFTEPLAGTLGIDMMFIPGSTFLMGSPVDELERFDDETQHEVTLSPFFMGKYPVTQAQWRFVAGLSQINTELSLNPSKFPGDNCPVEQVSWSDATEFCARLSQFTGRPYQLPSEAQWEYACRAGTTTPFHFGDTITTDLANYRGTDWEYEGKTYLGNYGDGPKGLFREETTEVGRFPANAFGLYDLHGNVYEWCQDHYHNSYEGAPADGSAWVDSEAAEDATRVIRGGSWNGDPRYCRSAYRYYFTPGVRYDNVGFRVVCLAPGL